MDELPVVHRRPAHMLDTTRKPILDSLPLHFAQLISTRHCSNATNFKAAAKSICRYCLEQFSCRYTPEPQRCARLSVKKSCTLRRLYSASQQENRSSPAECRLVEEVLGGSFLDELAARLLKDKAANSDVLSNQRATNYGIALFAPTQRQGKIQDGRSLRRYRRWKVERLFAWLPHCAASLHAGNAT